MGQREKESERVSIRERVRVLRVGRKEGYFDTVLKPNNVVNHKFNNCDKFTSTIDIVFLLILKTR